MKEYKYRLEGLGCANCANKMQNKISLLPNFEAVSIDFVQERLKFLKATAPTQEEINKIQEIVASIEADVKLVPFKDTVVKVTEEKSVDKNRLFIVLFLFFISFFLPLDGFWKISFYLITYLLIAHDIIRKTYQQVRKGSWFDENFLMTIATFGAFAIGEYREAIAVMLFYQIGEYLQNKAINQSRQSINQLLDLKPDTAWIQEQDQWIQVHPENVKPGQLIQVKPGEKIPLDGVLVDGHSTIDSSALTGESLPQNVEVGQPLASGAINLSSPLKIKVTKSYDQSTANQIIEMVENASQNKAPTEKFISQFARYYTPIVILLAVLVFLVPPLFVNDLSWSESFYRGLQFLVVSCPCALVISIPLTFFAGIGSAANKGILVKGGNLIERLTKVEGIAFDKTGTLTKGQFELVNLENLSSQYSNQKILEILAHLENHSPHPLAKALRKAYSEKTQESRIQEIEELIGRGVKGKFDQKVYYAGNQRLMQDLGYSPKQVVQDDTLIYLADDHEILALLHFKDQIKPEANTALKHLRQVGIQNFYLLSGDRQEYVDQIAQELEIDQAHGNLLPQDKLHHFQAIKAKSKQTVAFIGDGINDAPVLALADIGISMGALGSDAAIEASDLVIMEDSLEKIAQAIKISRKTLRIAKENIYLALGIKLVFLILASLGLTAMWEAILADVGITLLAVFNSLRALK